MNKKSILDGLNHPSQEVRIKTTKLIENNVQLLVEGISHKNLQIRRTCELLLCKYYRLFSNAPSIWMLPVEYRWEYDFDIGLQFYNIAEDYYEFELRKNVYGYYHNEDVGKIAAFFYFQYACKTRTKEECLEIIQKMHNNYAELNNFAAYAECNIDYDEPPPPIECRIRK